MLDTSKLSPAEKKQLKEELLADEKLEKQKIKDNKKAYKELSREFVDRNIEKLVNHKEFTEHLLANLFEDYLTIKELKKQIYGNKHQDSHTSTLEDGSASITIGHNVSIKFDGTESAGVEKITNYIATLSSDDENSQKLGKIVKTLLKPSAKTQMLNPANIIQLNNLRDDFNSDEFNDGLDIIVEAQIRTQNSMYVSGWRFVMIKDRPKKVEFRFTV